MHNRQTTGEALGKRVTLTGAELLWLVGGVFSVFAGSYALLMFWLGWALPNR
jgi:hypothetical protein